MFILIFLTDLKCVCVCVCCNGCNEIIMCGMKEGERSTAAIHQPSRGAGSAERAVGWHRCRSRVMVDDVIRAFTVSQGFCPLVAASQEDGAGKEPQ